MKVITEPSVTIVSAPRFFAHPVYELPDSEVEGEKIIAMAGKLCYDAYGKDGRSVDAHVTALVESGHFSVLEHVHVGLFIEGISRGCSHEIVRHRHFNYSQRSTRYTAEDDAAIVLDPYYASIFARELADGTVEDEEYYLVSYFIDHCRDALARYRDQVKRLETLNPNDLTGRDLRKWCRGKARQLLPHALETRLVMTGNLRAWRHFIVMRSSRHAEAEIRRLAQAVFRKVSPLAPHAFWRLSGETVDGFLELTETQGQ